MFVGFESSIATSQAEAPLTKTSVRKYYGRLYRAILRNDDKKLAELLYDSGSDLNYHLCSKNILLGGDFSPFVVAPQDEEEEERIQKEMTEKGIINKEDRMESLFALSILLNRYTLTSMIVQVLEKKNWIIPPSTSSFSTEQTACRIPDSDLPPGNASLLNFFNTLSASVKNSQRFSLSSLTYSFKSPTLSPSSVEILKTESKKSPLVLASERGYIDILRFLLGRMEKNSKVFVNVSERDLDESLLSASKEGHGEIVSLLLAHGANPYYEDAKGHHALMLAILNDRVNIIPAFIQHSCINKRSEKTGNTPLIEALKKGNEDVILSLLQNGASLELTDAEGMTPLHHVAVIGEPSLASLLLQKGAFVGTKDKNGRTPLHLSVQNGHSYVSAYLISRGILKLLNDSEREEILSVATKKKDTNTVQLIQDFIDEEKKKLEKDKELIEVDI